MKGAEQFKQLLLENTQRPLLLYGDPDVDGLISLLLMCQFCDMMGLKYNYYVNENRHHGFDISPDKLKGYMIIASDFQITEREVEAIVNQDIVLLSTDHHDCQDTFIDVKADNAEGIVINNQYPFEPEEDRYLSGAGVFYELICSIFPDFKSKEREALVGVTLLSDIREIENKKAKQYLKTTYTIDSTKGYANYLIKNTLGTDYTFGVPKLDRNFIDYTLSPMINALLRFNKTTEAVQFILGKGLAKRDCKEAQSSLVLEMKSKVSVLPLPSIDILALNELDFIEHNVSITNFIGLLCSDWKGDHNKSVLGLVYENGKITRASFRGKYNDVYYISSFRALGINAQGHPQAFGIIDFEPERDLWVQLNDVIMDIEQEHQQTIKIIETASLSVTLLQQGMSIATENCYVREMYRTFIKYTGQNASIQRITYQYEEFTDEDYKTRVIPDKVQNGINYKYVRDTNGKPLPKYIEYMIDGRTLKSFGTYIEDGVIEPILEKGYIQLYIKPPIE